jgi:hypothetical protein
MNGGNKPTFALRPIPYYVGLFRKRGKRRYMVAYYQNRPHSHLAWHMSFIHNLYPSSATPLLAFLTTVIMTNVIYTIHTLPSLHSFFFSLSLSIRLIRTFSYDMDSQKRYASTSSSLSLSPTSSSSSSSSCPSEDPPVKTEEIEAAETLAYLARLAMRHTAHSADICCTQPDTCLFISDSTIPHSDPPTVRVISLV